MDTIYRRVSEQLLSVPCGRCGNLAKHKVMTILAEKKVMCPSCGSMNAVDTTALEEKIGAAQERRNALRAAAPAEAATDARSRDPAPAVSETAASDVA